MKINIFIIKYLIDMSKKELGQFYTTNYETILQYFDIPKHITHIIEPFAGNGDLLKFINVKGKYKIKLYDIKSTQLIITQRDTIKNPPTYKNKYVITNPPYLAKNKSKNKELFTIYNTNDLYKCFLKTLIKDNPLGGILILPINFLSSIRKSDIKLRAEFVKYFTINKVVVYEDKVFDDTSSTVCTVQFELKNKHNKFQIIFVPSNKTINVRLRKKNNYIIGGHIYKLPINTTYKISRLLKGQRPNTYILAKCLDDNADNKICLKT